MRRTGPQARSGPPWFRHETPAGGGVLIARIVLALLLIAALMTALLYAAGALHDDAPTPFNLVGPRSLAPASDRSALS